MTLPITTEADIIRSIIADAQDAIELATGRRVRLVTEKAFVPKSMEHIASVVCEIFGVTFTHLRSRSSLRRIVDARKAFILLYYSIYPMDLCHKTLGRFFDRRRTSIKYLTREASNLLALDRAFEEKYQVCRAEIERN